MGVWWRRMRRAAALLVVGAVVNVAVAWWGTAVPFGGRGGQGVSSLESGTASWPEEVPESWPRPRLYMQVNCASCSEFEMWYCLATTEHATSAGTLAPEVFLTRSRSGFPLRSMEWHVLDEVWARSPGGKTWKKLRGAVSMPSVACKIVSAIRPEPVTLWTVGIIPVWPGFAVNTLVYAVVLVIPPFGCRRLLQTVRRRRGLCIACGYDAKGLAVCPECGR